MTITPSLCRAARALLAWKQDDLAAASGVNKRTILKFENGLQNPFPRTLRDLLEALEKAGVVFIESKDGFHQAGVALRWGVTETRHSPGKTEAAEGGSNDELSAHAWDDDFEEFASDQPVTPYIIPISDSDRAILRRRFAEHPDAWNKLSDRAKAIYRRELGMNDTVSQINNQNA